MSNYKLVKINPKFTVGIIEKTGTEQILEKASRSFVGLYDDKNSWYIPLRANLGKWKPKGTFFKTPFKTNNPHFKNPGLDFQKALYVPNKFVIEAKNKLPPEQRNFIENNIVKIKNRFEKYVLSIEKIDKKSHYYEISTVPLFPEGIQRIKDLQKQQSIDDLPFEPTEDIIIEAGKQAIKEMEDKQDNSVNKDKPKDR
jgi:hypothetical protein